MWGPPSDVNVGLDSPHEYCIYIIHSYLRMINHSGIGVMFTQLSYRLNGGPTYRAHKPRSIY